MSAAALWPPNSIPGRLRALADRAPEHQEDILALADEMARTVFHPNVDVFARTLGKARAVLAALEAME